MAFDRIRILWRTWTMLDHLESDIKNMNAKSIFLSKTFWLNVIGIGLTWAGQIPNPEIAMYVLAALNIANRFLTNQPVKILVTDT